MTAGCRLSLFTLSLWWSVTIVHTCIKTIARVACKRSRLCVKQPCRRLVCQLLRKLHAAVAVPHHSSSYQGSSSRSMAEQTAEAVAFVHAPAATALELMLLVGRAS